MLWVLDAVSHMKWQGSVMNGTEHQVSVKERRTMASVCTPIQHHTDFEKGSWALHCLISLKLRAPIGATLSQYCDQEPPAKATQGKVSCDSLFKNIVRVPLWLEVMAAGAWGSWPRCIPSQEAKRAVCPAFSLSFYLEPQIKWWCCWHSRWAFLTKLSISGDIPIDTPRVVFPWILQESSWWRRVTITAPLHHSSTLM